VRRRLLGESDYVSATDRLRHLDEVGEPYREVNGANASDCESFADAIRARLGHVVTDRQREAFARTRGRWTRRSKARKGG
jgi:hypothetical protein